MSSKEVDASSLKSREKSGKAKTLVSGNYEAGKDFKAGTYDIVCVSGYGNVISDNLLDGGVNEVMSNRNQSMSIKKFRNAAFDDGVGLTISGCKVRLIPSK